MSLMKNLSSEEYPAGGFFHGARLNFFELQRTEEEWYNKNGSKNLPCK